MFKFNANYFIRNDFVVYSFYFLYSVTKALAELDQKISDFEKCICKYIFTYLFENYKNLVIKPKENEIKENPPSRSAKLRYAVRNKDKFFYPEELKKRFEHYLKIESDYV